MFISSYERRGFNSNVGIPKIYFKPYITYQKEKSSTLERVSNERNLGNHDSMTSFVKLAKRAKN